jgi:hypothetical protein
LGASKGGHDVPEPLRLLLEITFYLAALLVAMGFFMGLGIYLLLRSLEWFAAWRRRFKNEKQV